MGYSGVFTGYSRVLTGYFLRQWLWLGVCKAGLPGAVTGFSVRQGAAVALPAETAEMRSRWEVRVAVEYHFGAPVECHCECTGILGVLTGYSRDTRRVLSGYSRGTVQAAVHQLDALESERDDLRQQAVPTYARSHLDRFPLTPVPT
jgi:hypothetical protein